MKEQYRNKVFNTKLRCKLASRKNMVWEAEPSALIEYADTLITMYAKHEIVMTLRQLYYQLVARDVIPNDQNVYKRISTLFTDARYAGLVDWDGIEDRTRTSSVPPQWDSLCDLLTSVEGFFRLPRWEGQDYYLELITEKQALESILAPIARKWHIQFTVNRGYCSASTMKSLADRIAIQISEHRLTVILCYLGDHDPSGLDMIRDIQDRITEFLTQGETPVPTQFTVLPIALTAKQIAEYNPPPNPAKISDPRAKQYIKQFGTTSWEVDALPPDVMRDLVEEIICDYVDIGLMQEIIDRETQLLAPLKDFAAKL